MGLQQQLHVALDAPALPQPRGCLRAETPALTQWRMLGSRSWTWDEDQYYFIVDLSFSFSSSNGDFLDAESEDRLAGSLITTSYNVD